MSEEIINADGSRNYQANILLDNVKRLEQENKHLQAENERLKKEIWKLLHHQMWGKEATLQAELLIKENEEVNKNLISERQENAELATENWKLRQALEEIREIANVIINGQHITDDIEGHLKDIVKNHILTKISEVLG